MYTIKPITECTLLEIARHVAEKDQIPEFLLALARAIELGGSMDLYAKYSASAAIRRCASEITESDE